MPRDATSLEELERIVTVLVAHENRWRVYADLARRAGIDLPPPELWMLARLGEREPMTLGSLSAELKIPEQQLKPPLDALCDRGMTKDFVAISSMGYFDCLMVVNAQSEFKTLGDFLKVGREKPGKLNIGTISAGGVQNLTANYFKQASGLDVVIVPFRTTPDAIVALMRNDVEMVIDFYAALKSGLEDNKLRAVAWTGPQPSPALPKVPTALGEGVKGFEAASWNAIYAKAGTPPEVLATLNKAMQEVLAEPEVKKRLLDLGIDSKASTPAEMDAQMRGDITKWTEVIDRAGIEKR